MVNIDLLISFRYLKKKIFYVSILTDLCAHLMFEHLMNFVLSRDEIKPEAQIYFRMNTIPVCVDPTRKRRRETSTRVN